MAAHLLTSSLRPNRPIRYRNAAGTPAAPRTLSELTAERARLMGEADGLHTRSKTTPLNPEEETRLDAALAAVEAIDAELPAARRGDRVASLRAAGQQPARPPVPPQQPSHRSAGTEQATEAEAFRLWLQSFGAGADLTPDAHYRAAQHGFGLRSTSVKVSCSYGNSGTLNLKKRAISKTANPGQALTYTTYSDLVTEYLTYFSPLVGLVDSETTGDGNDRVYFKIDDTGMMSSYLTASGGTELAPTIPDNDLQSGSVTIKAYDVTSGYQKISYQSLRDSAVNLQDKAAKANANAHARRMEQAVLLGAGGSEPRGLLTAATVNAVVDDYTLDVVDDLYNAVPLQYRGDAIWVMNDQVAGRLRKKLRDSQGRPLWGAPDVSLYQGAPSLYGKRVVISNQMPGFTANAKGLMFVNPLFYMLRVVEGQTFQVLTEKFAPHLAFLGLMSFGGDYLGPASACQVAQLDATPANGAAG